MKDKYKDIDVNSEKINRIINCALEEFSKNTYEKASTNNIVKAANVSRGLMYHYFTDKQDLFDFLIEFSMKELATTFNENFDWNERDLLTKMSLAAKLKFDMYMRYPYMIDFCMNALQKVSVDEMRNSVREEYSMIGDKFYSVESIDLSKFKADVDVDTAIDVIQWTIEKHSEMYLDKIRSGELNISTEEILREIQVYIEFLRKTFYK